MLESYFRSHSLYKKYKARQTWVFYLAEVVVNLYDVVFAHLYGIHIPSPLFIFLSMLPPIDVKANELLYCRIFCKKCFDRGSLLLLSNLARNCGGSLNGGILSNLNTLILYFSVYPLVFFFKKPKHCVAEFAIVFWKAHV